MASGLDTLGSIDQGVDQVRRDIQELDRDIQIASNDLVRVGQEETKRFRTLAELRLDQLTRGPIVAGMDDADRRVTELLRQRTESLQALQGEIEESDRRQLQLEAERTTQQEKVHTVSQDLDRSEAATQKRLNGEPQYQAQLGKVQKSDGIAKHAEAKAEQAEHDRAEKGREYEHEQLFMYLWNRGYGTSSYSANPFFRLLDSWVAKLCRYHAARPNYSMLLEIPRRLREHAQQVRSDADRELASLREIEKKAAEADGVPALSECLQREQQHAQDIDGEIKQEETQYKQLLQKRTEFVGGEDAYSRQCLQVLVDQLRREPIPQLRREAEATSTAEDNVLVQEIADLEQTKQHLESQLAQHKELHLRHLRRLEELEKVRWDFKHRRYDDAHSTFQNGPLIGAMLTEFLRGMASSGQLWNTIERQHRRRPIEANPDFGSGGFGLPSDSVWHIPFPTNFGGGGRAMSRGGGFRTGGGF